MAKDPLHEAADRLEPRMYSTTYHRLKALQDVVSIEAIAAAISNRRPAQLIPDVEERLKPIGTLRDVALERGRVIGSRKVKGLRRG